MADAIGNDNDGLLLLELGIESDENEFDKARKQLEDLRGDLDDLEFDIDFSNLLSGLKSLGTAIKGIVDMWNSLESKTIDVAFSTNDYLPYNISAGQRQNIENRLAESKVAEKFGLSSDNFLGTLDSIINTQAKVKNQGKLNDSDATSLQQLGMLLNLPALQGSNLAGLFTDNSTTYVSDLITNALADAYRLAYSKPEGSEERQEVLKYIKNVEDTPFVTPEMSHYIAFMVNPNNPTYAKSGNPMNRFFSASVEDEGRYMENLQKWSMKAVEYSEDMSVLKSEIGEGADTFKTVLYNYLSETLVLPVLKNSSALVSALSGKRRIREYVPEHTDALTYGLENTADPFHRTVTGNVDNLSALTARFGLSSNWVVNSDTQQRILRISDASSLPHNASYKDNVLANELRFYELMKLSDMDYEGMAQNTIQWAIQNIFSTHTKDFEYGRKSSTGFKNIGDSYNAISKELLNPSSQYYIGEDSGFASIYAMMYRTGSFNKDSSKNQKEYLETMAKAFENTKMGELHKFFGLDDYGTDITNAKVIKEGKGKDQTFKLELTIKEEGKADKTMYLTADELAQAVKASY